MAFPTHEQTAKRERGCKTMANNNNLHTAGKVDQKDKLEQKLDLHGSKANGAFRPMVAAENEGRVAGGGEKGELGVRVWMVPYLWSVAALRKKQECQRWQLGTP